MEQRGMSSLILKASYKCKCNVGRQMFEPTLAQRGAGAHLLPLGPPLHLKTWNTPQPIHVFLAIRLCVWLCVC